MLTKLGACCVINLIPFSQFSVWRCRKQMLLDFGSVGWLEDGQISHVHIPESSKLLAILSQHTLYTSKIDEVYNIAYHYYTRLSLTYGWGLNIHSHLC